MAEVKKRANRKAKYREINREEIRLYLSERGKVSHVLDLVEKLEDETIDLDPMQIQRKKIAIDTRLRLLNKYLPDEKSVEVKNAEGEAFKTDTKWQIEFVNAE
jgi:hypothetical protein